MRRLFLFLAPLLGSLAAAPVMAQEKVRAVLELFTSQGCSSCPSADAFLGSLQPRNDIITLTLPVDYWDYLGWKDTLAKTEFSKRQRDYAARRGDGHVYTPQIVINGRKHIIGSKQNAVIAAINDPTIKNDLAIRIEGHADGKSITVNAGNGSPKHMSGTIWLATVRAQVPVDIKHGENRGRTITYFNVVRSLSPIGMWSGEAMQVKLPYDEMLREGERCAIFIQAGHAGPIFAAAWMQQSASKN
ncbi:MAG: hypothetical protein RLZ98_1261 [Pseudomonadota bacterium]|jgi:hypothetical protein